jgi:hypothetical protein
LAKCDTKSSLPASQEADHVENRCGHPGVAADAGAARIPVTIECSAAECHVAGFDGAGWKWREIGVTTLATSSSDNAPIPFSISFLDDPIVYLGDDPTVPLAVGLLVIGDYQEEFCASLYEWTKDDYQAQWRNAILALLHGEDKVALMVYYVSQVYSDNIEWWPMYKLGETVVFQNHMPWYDQF